MAPETAPRSAPIALWRAAGAFLETLFQLFGAPAAIAALHVFDTRSHALVLAWLRAAEAILRQLLLIEAAALPKPNAPPPSARAQQRRAARVTPAIDLQHPEQWRVSFRCFASHCGGASGGFRERKAASRFHPSFPIAARMEALLRAFNDPAPYAQRLLRRLMRRPRRAADLLRAPRDKHPAAPRACAEIPDLRGSAHKAWAALDTG